MPHAPAAESRLAANDTHPSNAHATDTPEFTGKPAKLAVEIPKDLRKELRKVAERSGQSVDAVVTEALARHVTASD